MVGTAWQQVEEKALLTFVQECKDDALEPISDSDSVWLGLEKAWQALSKVKSFGTHRTAYALYAKHNRLRKEAGRENTLSYAANP